MKNIGIVTVLILLFTTGCATKISGMVKLVDKNAQPIATDKPEGIIVNMINTTSSLENASHSVKTDPLGNFESVKGKIVPGLYKVETSRIGYKTTTQTIEVKKFKNQKIELFLRKIATAKTKSIRGSKSDSDKIVNPGEVNIQPPSL